MGAGITFIGRLASKVLGRAIPGLPQLALYALAVLSVLGLIASVAFHQGAEGKAAALAVEKAGCEIRIANIEKTAQMTIADIQSAINDEPLPKPSELEALCARSSMCRESGQ